MTSPQSPQPDSIPRWRSILGWSAYGISLFFAVVWSWWGVQENFHEGWYSTSVWENLGMLFGQYLSITIMFVVLPLIALRWRRTGLVCFIVVGLFAAWFFRRGTFSVIGLMIVLPFLGLGLMYYLGRIKRVRLARWLLFGLPLLIVIALGIPNFIRVQGRVNDGDFGLRVVEGNGVTLAWAPKGPGWPDGGISWFEAQDICSRLTADGTMLADTALDIWRLPTVDEAVRSQALHGINAGGVWDAQSKKAEYEMTPDKETPLWDMHSRVIYLWTADQADSIRAYIFVYDGGIWPKRAQYGPGYTSCRCVKDTTYNPSS